MRVTMLGISGSGKTTYMAGLAQQMSQSTVNGYTISPAARNPNDAAFARANFNSLLIANNNHDFPMGTTLTTNWTFNLCKNGKQVCFFDWIDFRGGYIDQLSDGVDATNGEEIKELLAYAEASEAVIIFIDAIRVFHYRKNKGAARHFTKAVALFHLLTDFAQGDSERTFIIVGTKADSDLIDAQLQANSFAGMRELISELFHDLYTPLLDAGWKGAITCVGAIGIGQVKSVQSNKDFRHAPTVTTEIIGFAEPINVEIPLLYCLLQQIRRYANYGMRSIANNEIELIQAQKDENLFNHVFAKIVKIQTPTERVIELSQKLKNENDVLAGFKPAIPELEKIVRDKIKVLSA